MEMCYLKFMSSICCSSFPVPISYIATKESVFMISVNIIPLEANYTQYILFHCPMVL